MQVTIPITVPVRTVTTELKTFNVELPVYSSYDFCLEDIDGYHNRQYTRIDEDMTRCSIHVMKQVDTGETTFTITVVPKFEFTKSDMDFLGLGENASSKEEFDAVVQEFKETLAKLG